MHETKSNDLKKAWEQMLQDMFRGQAIRCAELVKQQTAQKRSVKQLKKELDELEKCFELIYRNK